MTTTLDDRDPGFTYKGVWTLQGNPTAEFDGTTTATYVAGSTASLTFAGLQITVFGTIAPNGTGVAPSSSYSIDGGPQKIFTGVQQSGAQYTQTFFQSGILSGSVKHTLSITSLIDNGEFFLDFVNILNATATTTPPTSQVTSPVSLKQTSTSPVTTLPGPM
ncbi:hypothetical protein HYPSUDRAFT_69725 [Hypholoma sublateritium FD-334 SS-4]|uniref:Uncharacterized protein n=1 Tax=Hypholoma sublateritium (strain FD-334 SS-4) TaxID=945553 RepID=A0A0D2M674_HYPSF|nr:hypothetical protein HYPSUDRAFT_69725 [Hypholoma sublateritium FD-334 SS-4]